MRQPPGPPIDSSMRPIHLELDSLLQSSQVSDRELVGILLQEVGEEIALDALEHFQDGGLARQVLQEVLARAVASRKSYWGEVAVGDWLVKVQSQVFQEISQKKGKLIVTVDYSATDRGAFITSIEVRVKKLRQQGHTKKLLPIASALGAIILIVGGLLWWVSQPERDPAYIPPDQAGFYFLYQIQPGDTLASISQFSGISTYLIREMNPKIVLPRSDQAQVRKIGGRGGVFTIKLPALPLKMTIVEQLESELPRWQPIFPLTVRSTPEDIRQRILQSSSYWQSMLANLWVTAYAAPGDFHNASQYEYRVSLRKPGLSRVEAMNRDGSIDYIYYTHGEQYYSIAAETNQVMMANIHSVNIWDWSKPPELDLHSAWTWKNVHILGMEKVAGREALVLDWYDTSGKRTSRLWVDTNLGMILAWREYGGADDRLPVQDIVLTDVKIDQKIGNQIFDPLQGHQIKLSPGYPSFKGMVYQPNLKWMPAPTISNEPVRPPVGVGIYATGLWRNRRTQGTKNSPITT